MGSLFRLAGFIALGLVPVVGSPGEYAYDAEGGEEAFMQRTVTCGALRAADEGKSVLCLAHDRRMSSTQVASGRIFVWPTAASSVDEAASSRTHATDAA